MTGASVGANGCTYSAAVEPPETDGTVIVGIAFFGGSASGDSGSACQVTFQVLEGFTGEQGITLTQVRLGCADGQIDQQTETGGSFVVIGGAAEQPTGDFDGDGTIGFKDFISFAQVYGSAEGGGRYDARYDMDMNGSINFADFIAFAYGGSIQSSVAYWP